MTTPKFSFGLAAFGLLNYSLGFYLGYDALRVREKMPVDPRPRTLQYNKEHDYQAIVTAFVDYTNIAVVCTQHCGGLFSYEVYYTNHFVQPMYVYTTNWIKR